MEIIEKKLELIEWIAHLQDERIISSLSDIKLWETDLISNKITIEELESRIHKSEQDIEQGNVMSHEDLIEEIKNW